VVAPTLVIAGGKDFQAGIEPQRELVARLKRGRLIEYRGNGHFMFVEDPRRFARDVTAFLRTTVRN
jgi:proline iminopeptidase